MLLRFWAVGADLQQGNSASAAAGSLGRVAITLWRLAALWKLLITVKEMRPVL